MGGQISIETVGQIPQARGIIKIGLGETGKAQLLWGVSGHALPHARLEGVKLLPQVQPWPGGAIEKGRILGHSTA